MKARTLDRQAIRPGGRFVVDAVSAGNAPEALLALSDGSVWRGRSVGSAAAVAGVVSIVGDLVVVEGDDVGLLRDVELGALARHLTARHAEATDEVRGCLTAAGAILPQHAAVARAIARGEIGRP